jgi:hypothetical protein
MTDALVDKALAHQEPQCPNCALSSPAWLITGY